MASSIEDLRSKLAGLADMLGGPGNQAGVAVAVSVSPPRSKPRPAAATAAAPPGARRQPLPPRQFQPTVRPSTSVLQAANMHARDAPIGGLLAKYKDAEQAWLKEKGRLQMAVKSEQQRRVKAEGELRRAQDQLAYRVGEVKHLKEALRGRDARITALEDSLRLYELEEGGERTAQETRDELRASMQELLSRLSAANGVISQADESMLALSAQLEEAVEARSRAEEEAAVARQEAEGLREAVSDLQFRTGLLQQLSDLQLTQNEDKTATLRALLQSESLLDAAGGGMGMREGLASSSDSEDGGSQ